MRYAPRPKVAQINVSVLTSYRTSRTKRRGSSRPTRDHSVASLPVDVVVADTPSAAPTSRMPLGNLAEAGTYSTLRRSSVLLFSTPVSVVQSLPVWPELTKPYTSPVLSTTKPLCQSVGSRTMSLIQNPG